MSWFKDNSVEANLFCCMTLVFRGCYGIDIAVVIGGINSATTTITRTRASIGIIFVIGDIIVVVVIIIIRIPTRGNGIVFESNPGCRLQLLT